MRPRTIRTAPEATDPMIVVVGILAWRPGASPAPAGRAAAIALSAAAAGGRVELVGRVGDDDAGDALLLALSQGGVGHVAVLRDAARPTPVVSPAPAPLDAAGGLDAEEAPEVLADGDAERDVAEDEAGRPAWPGVGSWPVLEPADVALGLRYLTEFQVIVLADDVPSEAIPVAAEAAAYASARLVLLVPPGSEAPPRLPADATVLAAPGQDPGDRFASMVGTYAAGLEGGRTPAEAFAAAAAATGWEEVGA